MHYRKFKLLTWLRDACQLDASYLRNASVSPSCWISGLALIDSTDGPITIGEKCTLHRYTMIVANGGPITIGAGCSVNPYTVLYSGKAGLTIGDNVRIAAHVVVIPENHLIGRVDMPIRFQGVSSKGVSIGSDVWIGTGAKILDGVSIGDGCVIGANAVVVKSLPPYSVAVGVPARVIRSRLE